MIVPPPTAGCIIPYLISRLEENDGISKKYGTCNAISEEEISSFLRPLRPSSFALSCTELLAKLSSLSFL